MALIDDLKQLGLHLDRRFLPQTMRMVANHLMEMDLYTCVEAGPYERSDQRATYRNGYRKTTWRTRYGKLPLRVPKLRSGSYYPVFLNHVDFETTVTQFLLESYVFGLRHSDVLRFIDTVGIEATYGDGILQLMDTLEGLLAKEKQRVLPQEPPYLWLDTIPIDRGTFPERRERIMALAVGINHAGHASLLQIKPGFYVDDAALWTDLLESLAGNGLETVETIISGAYPGIKAAIQDLWPGALWQYRQSDLIHDLLRYVPETEHGRVTDAISTLWLTGSPAQAKTRLGRLIGQLPPEAALYLGQYRQDLQPIQPTCTEPVLTALDTLHRIKQNLTAATDAIAVTSSILTEDISGTMPGYAVTGRLELQIFAINER